MLDSGICELLISCHGKDMRTWNWICSWARLGRSGSSMCYGARLRLYLPLVARRDVPGKLRPDVCTSCTTGLSRVVQRIHFGIARIVRNSIRMKKIIWFGLQDLGHRT